MVKGYPDWGAFEGRSTEGEEMVSFTFSGTLAAGATGIIDTTTIPTSTEHVFQNITISCPDDTAIHRLILKKSATATSYLILNFITGGILDFPGQSYPAGEFTRITITNNATETLTFEGAINWVIKAI